MESKHKFTELKVLDYLVMINLMYGVWWNKCIGKHNTFVIYLEQINVPPDDHVIT